MRIVVSEFLSQDGVMEDLGGEGRGYGGWTFRWHNGEIEREKQEGLFASDALVLGRVTYEAFAAAWPSATDDERFASTGVLLATYQPVPTTEEQVA